MFAGSTGVLGIKHFLTGVGTVTLIEQDRENCTTCDSTCPFAAYIPFNWLHANAIDFLSNTAPQPFNFSVFRPAICRITTEPCCHLLEQRGWLQERLKFI
ncbi:MAG: hypothetical protein R3E08_02590 [Thiotrichaceae bacterium]